MNNIKNSAKSFAPTQKTNEDLFNLFKFNAEQLGVSVLRAFSNHDAIQLILKHIKQVKVKKIVSVPLNFLNNNDLKTYLEKEEFDFCQQLDQKKIEDAEIGISEFDLGIAQLGTIVQDATSLHSRLVSMLPPVHIAIVFTTSLVESFNDALEKIEKKYQGKIPPYLSFITGPSKTADIERELTIGVHGPGKLIILFIDENIDKFEKA